MNKERSLIMKTKAVFLGFGAKSYNAMQIIYFSNENTT